MNKRTATLTRRKFCAAAAGTGLVSLTATPVMSATPADRSAKGKDRFHLRYVLASAMYGTTPLAEILPEVRRTGADAIDLWPRVHGNQREQVEAMGEQAFQDLLSQNHVRLGAVTQYPLGPFGLQDEMRFAARLGGPETVLITGGRGPVGLHGTALKSAVAMFVEKLKPHLAVAEETKTILAIENHAHSLIDSPDSIQWLSELAPSPRLGIALAPHHLPQNAEKMASLIADLGPRIAFFYAQQHGHGSTRKLPKKEEILQLPGRGPLDFVPIVTALKKAGYQGYTEIFMHPTPRGIPILATTAAVSREINRARGYLDQCCQKI